MQPALTCESYSIFCVFFFFCFVLYEDYPKRHLSCVGTTFDYLHKSQDPAERDWIKQADEKWEKQRDDHLRAAVCFKVLYDEELTVRLLMTSDYELICCSRDYQTYYGTGILLKDAPKKKGKGQNMLGKTLMTVRSRMRAEAAALGTGWSALRWHQEYYEKCEQYYLEYRNCMDAAKAEEMRGLIDELCDEWPAWDGQVEDEESLGGAPPKKKAKKTASEDELTDQPQARDEESSKTLRGPAADKEKLNAELARRDQTIEDRDATIEMQDAELNSKDKEIDEMTKQLREMELRLREREKEVSDLQAKSSGKRAASSFTTSKDGAPMLHSRVCKSARRTGSSSSVSRQPRERTRRQKSLANRCGRARVRAVGWA